MTVGNRESKHRVRYAKSRFAYLPANEDRLRFADFGDGSFLSRAAQSRAPSSIER